MQNYKEFTIESRKDNLFRVGKISPVQILAVSMVTDLTKLEQTEVLYKFALENTEVKLGEKWVPVKTKDKEIYMPIGIDEDINALNEIAMYILREVIYKAFPKSDESE